VQCDQATLIRQPCIFFFTLCLCPLNPSSFTIFCRFIEKPRFRWSTRNVVVALRGNGQNDGDSGPSGRGVGNLKSMFRHEDFISGLIPAWESVRRHQDDFESGYMKPAILKHTNFPPSPLHLLIPTPLFLLNTHNHKTIANASLYDSPPYPFYPLFTSSTPPPRPLLSTPLFSSLFSPLPATTPAFLTSSLPHTPHPSSLMWPCSPPALCQRSSLLPLLLLQLPQCFFLPQCSYNLTHLSSPLP